LVLLKENTIIDMDINEKDFNKNKKVIELIVKYFKGNIYEN